MTPLIVLDLTPTMGTLGSCVLCLLFAGACYLLKLELKYDYYPAKIFSVDFNFGNVFKTYEPEGIGKLIRKSIIKGRELWQVNRCSGPTKGTWTALDEASINSIKCCLSEGKPIELHFDN